MRRLKDFISCHSELSSALLSIICACTLMCACLFPYRALMANQSINKENDDPFSARTLSLVCPVGITYELEQDLLARFISYIAEDEPYVCRVAIGAVVCNRMHDAHFADDLASVLSDLTSYYGNEAFLSEPSQRSLNAARDALLGIDPSGGALYFSARETKMGAAEAARITVTYGSFSFLR